MTKAEQRLHDMADRDLLIQTATNTENLCNLFTEFKKNNTGEHRIIFRLFEKRVPYWVFFPVIILIVGVIVSLSGFTVSLQSGVIKNTLSVEKIEKRMDKSPW